MSKGSDKYSGQDRAARPLAATPSSRLERGPSSEGRLSPALLETFPYISSPAPLHALDEGGRVVGVSDDWLALLGYEREEVIGRPLTDFLTEPSAAIFRERVQPLIWRARELSDIEMQFVRKTGEIIDTRVSARIAGQGEEVFCLAAVLDVTLRKRIEQALIESEERFRNLSEATLEGLLIHDDERVLDANERLAEMCGYRLAECIGRSPLDFIAPSSHELVTAKARKGDTGPYDILGLRRDGSTFPVEICGRRIQWRGRTARVVVIRDISLRQQAQREAQESKERLDFAEEVAGIGSWHWDLATNTVRWSPEFYRVFGLDPGLPLTYERLLEILPAEHRRDLTDRLRRLVVDGGSYRSEFRIDRGDGVRWIAGRGRAITVDGRPAQVIGTVMDITERKLVEEALRREQDFSHRVIENIGEGIFAYDRRGRVTLWNSGMERLLGTGREEIIGQNFLERYPWYKAGAMGQAIGEAVAGRETRIDEGSYVDPATRRQRWFEAHHSPLRDAEGAVVGGIAFVRDTTERHQMEEALRQAQKMETVGELTGGIAHDFNNMLTIIAGNLEMLEGKLAQEPALRRLVTAALFGVSRAERLTQHLLAFARRQRLDPRNVDIAEVIGGIFEVLKGSLSERITIVTEIPADLWPAYIDTNQLETALLNLVINARDAMANGGRIDIAARNISIAVDNAGGEGPPTPGDYVVLSVTDTGAGMPPEVLSRVFEPFFTTKTGGKGSGLGLAMVHGFARQSGGHVELESHVGMGTTFRLYLPRARAAAEPTRRLLLGGTAPHGNETVLVVEDESDVRRFSVSLLEDLGYRVFEAADGETALRLLREHPIELLFCDVVLPGRWSGPELVNLARNLKPDLKVLMTSGYVPPSSSQGAIESEPFIGKPFRPHDLAARIRTTLDGPAR